MIKFPKSANRSFLKTGNVQTQPVAKVSISGMSEANAEALSKISGLITKVEPTSGVGANVGRPTGQESVSSLLKPSGNKTNLEGGLSSNLKDLGHYASSVTGFGNNTQENNIVTYSNDSTPQKPISEFEKLTNISDSRPEVIALTDFHPLYLQKDAEQTEHGKLFDVYVQTMRQIENDATAINRLKNEENVKKRNEAIKRSVSSLTDAAKSVYQILKRIELDRKRLNLLNEVYDFSAIEFVNKEIPEDSKVDKDLLKDYCKILTTEKTNLVKVLSLLTGIQESDLSKFSSTKLWLTLVKEMQSLLNLHISTAVYDSPSDAKFIPKRTGDEKLPIFLKFEKSDGIVGTDLTVNSGLDLDVTGDVKDLIVSLEKKTQVASQLVTRLDELKTERDRFANIFSYLKTSLEEISKDDTKVIAVIFNSVCKEIRVSSCYDPSSSKLANALNFFNTSLPGLRASANDKSANYDFLEKVIGNVKSGDKVYSPVNVSSQNSLKGLSFLLTNDKSVLTLEESENQTIKSEKNTFPNIVDAGSYIYSEERLVEFVDSNGNYDLRTRANLLGNKLSSLDLHFSTIAYDLGMLSTKDSQVFNKDFSPSYVSTDPTIFFNKVFGVLSANLNKAEFDYNNPNLGVISFLKHLNKPKYVNLKSLVYLMVHFYNSSPAGSFDLIDVLIYRFLQDRSVSLENMPQEIKDDLDAIKSSIEKQGKAAANTKSEKSAEATFGQAISQIENILQSGEFSWRPCRYEDATKFGETLRANPVFILIAEVLKEVEKVLFTYASGNLAGLTSFNGVSFETIKLMTFEALMKFINLMEGSEVRVWQMGKDIIKNNTNAVARLPGENDKNFNVKGAASNNNYYGDADLIKYREWTSFVQLPTGYGPLAGELKGTPIGINIKKEISYLNTSIITALNTIKTLKNGINDSLATINSLAGVELTYLAQYMGGKEKLKFLLSKNQLNLLLSNLEDMNASIEKFSSGDNSSKVYFNNHLETLSHSDKMVKVLKRFFNNQEFSKVKGYNKKIITIGLAQNLIKNLLTQVQLEKVTNKHDDIIKVSIYKMDLLNSDVIYLPKTFLFEASRYPMRVVDQIPNNVTNIKELFTRNYSFYNKSNAKDNGEVSTMVPKLDDEEYSFLNDYEKSQIIENHIISFLLENYLKITTGLVLNETTFNLDTAEAEALLSLEISQNRSKNNFGNATTFSEKIFPSNIEFLKKLVSPKKFDRVFNIIFDPEFQVDVSATQSTTIGKKLLESMVSLGKIRQVGNRYYDNDKSESDVTLYSYFAVLETHAKSIKMSIDKQTDRDVKQSGTIKNLAATQAGGVLDAFNDVISGQNFGFKL
jgi:hypothetical protein